MRKYFLLLILLMVVVSCSKNEITQEPTLQEEKTADPAIEQGISFEELTVKTEDNANIAANYYSKDSNKKAVILLHMLNSNKDVWKDVAELLANNGYNAIAIDLRGHGNSVMNGKTWESFSEEDFNNMIFDVRTANNFLIEKGFADVAIIGASIGANLAVIATLENENIKAAVLLSPGLEYRGISIEQLIKDIDKPLLIIAGQKDKYSASSSNYLKSATPKATLQIIEATDAHGTNLFNLNIGLENEILGWLNENIQ